MKYASSNCFSQSVTTNWVSLNPVRADVACILNNTGADLLVNTIRDLATQYITIKDGASVAIPVMGNTQDVRIKAAAGAAGVNVVAYTEA